MPDRSTGDLRFFELLKTMAREHRVLFCAYDTVAWLSCEEQVAYRGAMEDVGIKVLGPDPIAAIRFEPLDAVLFEYHHAAASYTEDVRFWQPDARILVDCVDVHFSRLFAKARVTGSDRDVTKAHETRARELAAYRSADVVIAVSDEDRHILQRELGELPIEVIPIIQAMPPLVDRCQSDPNALLFIGNFNHDPNVDAMLYFCAEVLPLIRKRSPDVRLTIVGNSPPDKVKQLAGEGVEVLGFVPDLRPVLAASGISVAPLRYGGGIKGKVAEAMAFGLPVATTSFGIEGFGLTPGENVLIGDTPEAFADAVVELVTNEGLRERLRRSAWTFVDERYSQEAVARQVHSLIGNLYRYPVKKLPLRRAVAKAVQRRFDQHIGWRLRQEKG
jgi:glycosyltransferase involved in cell wall biosynthesis